MIWDRNMETMNRDKLKELQRSRLRWTLTWAKERVPFYRERLDRVGFGDADPLQILAELPFTHKSDLRNHYPLGMLAVPRHEVRRFHASSGTKGKPTVVAYTEHDLVIWAEVVARSLAAAGMKPGQTLHNAYGYGLFTGGLGLHAGAERLGVSVIPASGGNTERQVELISDLAPDALACTPSYALYIAETMARLNIAPKDLALKMGIFGAEPWTVGMRERLEHGLGIHAVDIYGLSEITGPGVAIECVEGQNGLHIFEDFFYAEVIDPASGASLEPGQVGELVLTTLSKEAMPMIRYRTGDLVSLNVEPCVCGRTSVRMSRVHGRSDDMLIVRGVNVFPSEVERIVLAQPGASPHYQLVWEGQASRPDLVVELEETQPQALNVDHLRAAFKTSLGVNLGVRVLDSGQIARSQGKAVRVLNRMSAG